MEHKELLEKFIKEVIEVQVFQGPNKISGFIGAYYFPDGSDGYIVENCGFECKFSLRRVRSIQGQEIDLNY